MEMQGTITNRRYTQPDWNDERTRYYCLQNDFGQWWADMDVRADSGGWCRIILRNSNPFKTLKGAIKFVERTKKQIEKRDAARH